MSHKSKKSKQQAELKGKILKENAVGSGEQVDIEVACREIGKLALGKFDETVEIAVRLGVDPKKADQAVKGSVVLPNGLGKTVRLAVFARGEKAEEARAAGADIVGAEDLVEEVKNGNIEFERVVATPDMMVLLAKIGKILGPRGLMPTPKLGTVTSDVKSIVSEIKAGQVAFRVDKGGNIHAAVGKASFEGQKLFENVVAVLRGLQRLKPLTSKGVYFKKMTISTTMSPSLEVEIASARAVV